MVVQRVEKPRTQRAKRELEKRDPKIFENDKHCMVLKGGKTSDLVNTVLKEMHALKSPLSVMYKKKNITRPFDDASSIVSKHYCNYLYFTCGRAPCGKEFFSNRCDASLFLFGSHSKKRPSNVVFGRLFDGHVLDMIEFGIENFKSMTDNSFCSEKVPAGTKPCLLFSGDKFDEDSSFKRAKNLFIDFFRGPVVNSLRLEGVEHVLSFTAVGNKISMRSYKILFKKSGQTTPRVELEEIGPALDLVMRRTHLASDDHYKQACKKPKTATIKKKKNISMDVFGTKEGRIHMERQDFSKLQTRKLKALKRPNPPDPADDVTAGQQDAEEDTEGQQPQSKRQRTQSEEST